MLDVLLCPETFDMTLFPTLVALTALSLPTLDAAADFDELFPTYSTTEHPQDASIVLQSLWGNPFWLGHGDDFPGRCNPVE